MQSALYRGIVEHRRHGPSANRFRKRVGMAYLDLDELDRVFEGCRGWAVDQRALVAFHRSDHFGDPAHPLAACVRDAVAARLGGRPEGPIRVLTVPRTLGLSFNPVSFFYCFARDGETVEAVLAEVRNTPWNERHLYAVPGDGLRARTPKRFHVSPFMGMEQEYRWALPVPGERLRARIESHERGERVFDAALVMSRVPITPRSTRRFLLRHPFLAAEILTAIYLHAARLALKRAPFHAHPGPTVARWEPPA